MEKYAKKVKITYFEKTKKVDISNINDNSIVYLKVKSPLSYGIRELGYYGKILHKTQKYFDILEYCIAETNYWYSDEILKRENQVKKYTKRWAKKSVKEIYLVSTHVKEEIKEFYKN